MSSPDEKDNTVVPLEKPKSEIPADSASISMVPGSAGNIDKIRDIIFGNQMQDYEKRFARLEERMFKEMTNSKSEARENFDSLEKNISRELASLKDRAMAEQNTRSESLKNVERQLEDMNRSLRDRITTERDARSESLKDIERQLKDVTRAFERRIDKLDEQLERSSKDMRQQMSEGSQSLRGEIRQKYEETVSAIERVAQELRVNKADRSALADFFTEMAMRLTNEGR